MNATICPIDHTELPLLKEPTSANDDLLPAPFRPIRYTWGREQRKGVLMQINDATSIDDHLNKDSAQGFLLPEETPLPTEVNEFIRLIRNNDHKHLRTFWNKQATRAQECVEQTKAAQRTWENAAPPR